MHTRPLCQTVLTPSWSVLFQVKRLEALLKESQAAERLARQRQAAALQTARSTAQSRAEAQRDAAEARGLALASGARGGRRDDEGDQPVGGCESYLMV